MSSRNKKIALLSVILLLISSIVGYMYYLRTPAHTLFVIKSAIEKHDYDTFNKHVDIENVLSTTFDVLVEDAIDEDVKSKSVKKIASGFAKMLKPTVVNALNDEIKQYIKTGKTAEEKAATQKDTKGKQATASKDDTGKQAAADIKKQSGFGTMTFKELGSSRDDGDYRIVSIILNDSKLGQDFTLELRMIQLEDGTWRIVEIANLKEYLKQVRIAKEKKLAEINKPIKEEIGKQISLDKPSLNMKTGGIFGLHNDLLVKTGAKISGAKQIASIEGNLRLKDKSGETTSLKYKHNINKGQGNYTLTIKISLNPLLDEQAKIVKNGISNYIGEVVIEKVQYADGSSIELKKALD